MKIIKFNKSMLVKILGVLLISLLAMPIISQGVHADGVITVTENPASNLEYNGTAQTLGTVTSNPSDATITYKVNNGTYSVDAPTATRAGTYTVGYKVIKSGYETKEGSFNVTIAPKSAPITITAPSKLKTYDGNVIDAGTATSNFNDVKCGNDALTVTLKYTGADAVKDAGVYNNEIVDYKIYDANGEDVTNCYTFADPVIGKLTINKLKITLTSGSDMVYYVAGDKESAHDESVAVSGDRDSLLDGEGLVYSGFKTVTTISLTPIENTFEYAPAAGSAFNANNYEITVKYGMLMLVDDFTIVGTDQTFKYDGTEHNIAAPIVITNESYDGITYATSTDNQEWSTFSVDIPKVKDAGVLYIRARAKKGVLTKDTTYKITVEKRNVTLTSESAEKTYDGTPLTEQTASTSGDGFAGAEGVTFNYTGTMTKAGSTDNTFTYTAKGTTDLNNYNITTVYGTLTVKAPPIDTAKSSNVTWNGNKLTTSFTQNSASNIVVDIDWDVPDIDNCAAGLYDETGAQSVKVCDCTCESGSIKVTIPASGLNTLSAGEHDLVLKIIDTTKGEAVYSYDLSVTVNGTSSNDSYTPVNTSVEGTNAPLKLVSLLSLVTLAGVITLNKNKH